ncbi:MAG: WYL domain-containing protein, partial [Actinocatenispora sp.]
GRAADRLSSVRGALARQRALRLRYYTAGRDETTDRVVDPMRLLAVGAWSYLEAWCRRAEAVRLFRLDRIDELTELSEPAAPPPEAQPSDLRGGVFQPTPDQPLVTLRVQRGARWITEYYPCEEVAAQPDGTWLVRLRASDLSWACRLVLGLSGEVDALGPPELVSLVGTEARAALALYQSTGDGPVAEPVAGAALSDNPPR